MGARLAAIRGPVAGREYTLAARNTVIGRDDASGIVLSDAAVSRRHALLLESAEGWVLQDLESSNGTFLNGSQIEENGLAHGDEITIGRSQFLFLLDEAEARPVLLHASGDAHGDTAIHLRGEDSFYLRPSPHRKSMAGFETLLGLAKTVRASMRVEDLIQELIGLIARAIGAGASFAVLDDEPRETVWSATDRLGSIEAPWSLIEKARQQDAGILPEAKGPIVAPIRSGEHCLGVLGMMEPAGQWGEDELQLVAAAAVLAGPVLEDACRFRRLEKERLLLEAQVNREYGMVGGSPAAQTIFRFIQRAGPAQATVLLLGETGTGKEVVARALHQARGRVGAPFIAINCAALTETLLESELFGHERGAFTGALAMKRGKIELAQGGTLFLDEVGELPLPLQAKLLRVLQEREFERVGGTTTIAVDFRLIAATNRDLPARMAAGAFREDLYHRLNVVSFRIPALRERAADIPVLARHFLMDVKQKTGAAVESISGQAMACLESYSWPGNVRELGNVIERAVVLGSGPEIQPEDLPESLLEGVETTVLAEDSYQQRLKREKKAMVLAALKESEGNFTEAARRLKVHPNSLHRLMRNLGLRDEAQRRAEV